jgi:hypothetical protein
VYARLLVLALRWRTNVQGKHKMDLMPSIRYSFTYSYSYYYYYSYVYTRMVHTCGVIRRTHQQTYWLTRRRSKSYRGMFSVRFESPRTRYATLLFVFYIIKTITVQYRAGLFFVR